MKSVLITILATFSFFPAQTLDSLINKKADMIIKSALTEQIGYQLLGELTELGGRVSGSASSLTVINWAKLKMEELGLANVYLQEAMVPHWVRNDIESAEIRFKKIRMANRSLNIAALGGSIGTPAEGIVGNVLEVKNFKELETKKAEAKGKIIFYNRAFDNTNVNPFISYGMAVDQRVFGAIEASKYGAKAVIVRSVTSKPDNTPHVGVMRYADSLAQIPACAIGVQDADFLSGILKTDPDLQISIKLNCENLPEIMSYNVIGEIEGSEYPDEIIVIGGHLDAWDKGSGAHDDGGGCMQSIDALLLLKAVGYTPKRTIRCVLFTNEENGSGGAEAYADSAFKSGEKHIAGIESDRGLGTPRGFSVTADSLTLKKMNSWLPLLNKSLIDWIRPGGSGADIGKIKNMQAYIGYVPDSQRYFDYHHSANDTFDVVHPREMQLGSASMAILLMLISEYGI